jgi:hypothetical protein
MKMCNTMAELKREVETIDAMKAATAKIIKKDFQEFWMGKERPNLASVGRVKAGVSGDSLLRPVSSGIDGKNAPELKLTGDPEADEKIRKFAEHRAAFFKKAEEARMSQTLG